MAPKASCIVCFFLFFPSLLLSGQDFPFEEAVQNAYHLALNLRCDEALNAVGDENSVEEAYVASLAETIELLITEDNTKFSDYEDRFQKRLDKDLKGSQRDHQFLQAEIRLHWAVVYIKFGHELDAALQLRQAYQIAEECKKKFPGYLPIRKTTGILEIIVGSVPDKYNWILNILNMSGSVSEGLADLQMVAASSAPLAMEGRLLHALVQGFLLSQPSEAMEAMRPILEDNKDHRLALFLSGSLALKNAENEVALQMLNDLSASAGGIPLYYADYLRGEAYLHKGDYLNAISSYQWFLTHQTGQNYIKDAWYKTGLCYWLKGNEQAATEAFQEAGNNGKESTEADKSAARNLLEKRPPHRELARARYFTDGGYYEEAGKILVNIIPGELPVRKELVEFYYRKARLAHKLKKPETLALYLRVIEMTGAENWYFAPNACLQVGYIFMTENKMEQAEEYFHRALSYRRHEYKNSIDSKARSALAQLRRI